MIFQSTFNLTRIIYCITYVILKNIYNYDFTDIPLLTKKSIQKYSYIFIKKKIILKINYLYTKNINKICTTFFYIFIIIKFIFNFIDNFYVHVPSLCGIHKEVHGAQKCSTVTLVYLYNMPRKLMAYVN